MISFLRGIVNRGGAVVRPNAPAETTRDSLAAKVVNWRRAERGGRNPLRRTRTLIRIHKEVSPSVPLLTSGPTTAFY
ncbi:hypothetical protein SRO_7023 [Streptomyces rochei]|nr:hypothetical protein SRO_7023 [Streptomyces rochei]